MKILGLIFVSISILFFILSNIFKKTRFFIFKDTSMIVQYLISILFMAIGVVLLYFAGSFN